MKHEKQKRIIAQKNLNTKLLERRTHNRFDLLEQRKENNDPIPDRDGGANYDLKEILTDYKKG